MGLLDVIFAPTPAHSRLHGLDYFAYSDWTRARFASSPWSLFGSVLAIVVYAMMLQGNVTRFFNGVETTSRGIVGRQAKHVFAPPVFQMQMIHKNRRVTNASFYHVEFQARKYYFEGGSRSKTKKTAKIPIALSNCASGELKGTSNCFDAAAQEPDFNLRGEYGLDPDYSYMQVAVAECNPKYGPKGGPKGAKCASEAEYADFWQENGEFQLCFDDILGVVEGKADKVWRCPIFKPIPDRDWLVRVEVYFKMHLVSLSPRWDIFELGWGGANLEYLSYSRDDAKLKSQERAVQSGSERERDIVKMYIRLDDVVAVNSIEKLTVMEVLDSAGASWVVVASIFGLLFKYLINGIFVVRSQEHWAKQHILDECARQSHVAELNSKIGMTVDERINALEFELSAQKHQEKVKMTVFAANQANQAMQEDPDYIVPVLPKQPDNPDDTVADIQENERAEAQIVLPKSFDTKAFPPPGSKSADITWS